MIAIGIRVGVALVAWLAASGCARRVHVRPALASPPHVGAQLDCQLLGESYFAIAPSQLAQACDVVVGGIAYRVASTDGKTIAFVSTSDPLFATPEGIKVGSTLREVNAKGGSEVFAVPGWSYYSRLPSGWNVAFPGIPGADIGGPPPTPETNGTRLWRN